MACCGGGGGCGGCPRRGMCRRPPIALVAFPRSACAQLLADLQAEVAAGKTPELIAAADAETGIVLQSAASHTTAAAEELDFNAAPIDPLAGWSYERAAKRKPLGLVCGTVATAVPLAALAEALEISTDPNPAFFAVVDETPLPEQHCSDGGCGGGGGCGGCGCGSRREVTAFSLRPFAYPRLSDAEYARAREPDAATWPPAPAPGLACGLVRGGFVVDQVAYACEQIRREEFLYTSKKPAVGLGVFLQLALLPDGFIRMCGKVTKVCNSFTPLLLSNSLCKTKWLNIGRGDASLTGWTAARAWCDGRSCGR